MAGPTLVVDGDRRSGDHQRGYGDRRGHVTHARASAQPAELDIRQSLLGAVARAGSPVLHRDDLHEKVRAAQAGTRYVFLVDSSGSHAVRQRMACVKGAVHGLLDGSVRRSDEIVVIVFRGTSATVLLEPTTNAEAARQALEFLPTGGRTPLAHALELGARYATARAVVIVLTDGKANVSRDGGDVWADALQAAEAILCPAVVIDSESGEHATGKARALADAMSAAYVTLDELDQLDIVSVLRDRAGSAPDRQGR
jgi:magnesium chelatase subunit D